MFKSHKHSSKSRRILFCSDPHIKHRPSWSPAPWESRGFSSGDEHDSWFRDQWFKLVDENTTVFCLGDVVFTDGKGEWFEQFIKWPGQTIHVWGNHPSGAKQVCAQAKARMFPSVCVDFFEVYPIQANNLTFVGQSYHAWIDGQSVWMQHYAPLIWPEMGNGGWALCGHSHGSCAQLNPDHPEGLILDVGVDNAIKYNGTPFFSWEEVKTIMVQKTKKVVDHHRGDVPGQ